MTRKVSLILALGLAGSILAHSPARAGEATPEAAAVAQAATTTASAVADTPEPAPQPSGYLIRRIDFGVSGVGTDTDSSRFREYRAVPTGVVLPFVRFAGDKDFRYDVVGENVLQRDARYRVLAEPGSFFGIRAEYQKIPHSFGNNGHTLLEQTAPGVLSMSDTLQQTFQDTIKKQFDTNKAGINFAFLNALVSPSLEAAHSVDLSLLRERGQVEVRLTRDKPYDIRLSYFQEKRRGDRAAGTSFGFGNVVETPEPIDYRTRDFGASLEWKQSWGLLRGGFHFNDFSNKIPSESFDNPFRALDSTDASAYTGPASGSIGGPRVGRVSLPPDNKSVTGSLGFLAKFGGNSRLSTDASLSQWTQNEPFMAFTTNTAIRTPFNASDVSTLPARSLDGKIKVFSLSSALTSRPSPHLNLAARFRRYDLSNDTPRIPFDQGYVRFDAVFEAIPRISVPYGYTTDALTLSASYDFGQVTVEGGYKLDRWDRTFRETEKTTQNVGYAKVDVRASDWLVLRGTAEKGSRSFSGLEIERSEDASQLNPGAPTNLLAVPAAGTTLCPVGIVCNLRYDQASKDLERYGAILELSPGGKATVTLSYLKGKDDYKESVFGLTKSDNESLTGEVDYTPTDRVNVFAFYTRENINTSQRGRQSGATVSTNPLDDWTSDIQDKVDSFGGGATLGLVKDKVDLKLYGNYQKVDGNNDIFSAVGGAPELARRAVGGIAGIPLFDDTKIYTLSGELAYKVTKTLTLGLGGWYEKYTLRDSNTSDITGNVTLANYTPGSFFLAAEDSDYKAHVVYVRVSYAW
jgi:MtrB/PioB family decaheme-associated outer membrane protein